MSTQRTPKSDKELWQSLALGQEAAPAAISDNAFAAWLEGRLPEAEAARVEAAVTRDAALRTAAIELADILGKPLPPPPARMAARAQALVGGGAAGRSGAPRGSWWPTSLLSGLLPSFDSGFALQRGVMAGVAVIVAAVGFTMGGGLGKSFVERRYASAEPSALSRSISDTSQQLNDLFADSI
ncbi:MAG: hypothetical protein JSR90_03420 [Proteobacteria bacterium]|nr:hypothetical protein [Pseudomonadota bacterium]